MDKGLLHKYASRIEGEGGEGNVLDFGAFDDLGCFGWLCGSRERALCLELRSKFGNCLALPYSFFERLEFNPSEGITLIAGRVQAKFARLLQIFNCSCPIALDHSAIPNESG